MALSVPQIFCKGSGKKNSGKENCTQPCPIFCQSAKDWTRFLQYARFQRNIGVKKDVQILVNTKI